MWKNDNMVEKNTEMSFFVKNKSLRSYTGHTKVGKNKFSDIIYFNSIDLIIYNEIQLKSIKNHINLRKNDKKILKHNRKTTLLS